MYTFCFSSVHLEKLNSSAKGLLYEIRCRFFQSYAYWKLEQKVIAVIQYYHFPLYCSRPVLGYIDAHLHPLNTAPRNEPIIIARNFRTLLRNIPMKNPATPLPELWELFLHVSAIVLDHPC
jgi:hypothetical protein